MTIDACDSARAARATTMRQWLSTRGAAHPKAAFTAGLFAMLFVAACARPLPGEAVSDAPAPRHVIPDLPPGRTCAGEWFYDSKGRGWISMGTIEYDFTQGRRVRTRVFREGQTLGESDAYATFGNDGDVNLTSLTLPQTHRFTPYRDQNQLSLEGIWRTFHPEQGRMITFSTRLRCWDEEQIEITWGDLSNTQWIGYRSWVGQGSQPFSLRPLFSPVDANVRYEFNGEHFSHTTRLSISDDGMTMTARSVQVFQDQHLVEIYRLFLDRGTGRRILRGTFEYGNLGHGELRLIQDKASAPTS